MTYQTKKHMLVSNNNSLNKASTRVAHSKCELPCSPIAGGEQAATLMTILHMPDLVVSTASLLQDDNYAIVRS